MNKRKCCAANQVAWCFCSFLHGRCGRPVIYACVNGLAIQILISAALASMVRLHVQFFYLFYRRDATVPPIILYTLLFISARMTQGCHFSTDSISMPCLVLLIGVAVWRLQLRPCFTTGNPIVAECKISSTRQTCHLPGAWRKTLGKKFHKSCHIACLNTNYKY